jgi:hypothetical protein
MIFELNLLEGIPKFGEDRRNDSNNLMGKLENGLSLKKKDFTNILFP